VWQTPGRKTTGRERRRPSQSSSWKLSFPSDGEVAAGERNLRAGVARLLAVEWLWGAIVGARGDAGVLLRGPKLQSECDYLKRRRLQPSDKILDESCGRYRSTGFGRDPPISSKRLCNVSGVVDSLL